MRNVAKTENGVDGLDIAALMADIGARAKQASIALAIAPAAVKTQALQAAADAVWAKRLTIISANQKDLEYGRAKNLSAAMLDRLLLDEVRIQGIVDGLRAQLQTSLTLWARCWPSGIVPPGLRSNGCAPLWV